MGFWDLIFPKKCVNCRKFGDYVCAGCFATISLDTQLICLVCNRWSFNGLTHPMCEGRYRIDGAFCGIVYGRVAKKLLYCFKYHPFVSDLSTFMTELFYEGLIQNESFVNVINTKPVLTSVPLSNERFRTRGYNQSRILARELSRKLGLETIDLLVRMRETKPQFGLRREQRRENMKDAFALKTDMKLPMSIVIVDDVLTSGSTVSEAADVLKRAGVKNVWGVSFARDQRDG